MTLMKEDLAAISILLDEKLDPVKKDVADLKEDVAVLKEEVAVLKTDMKEAKADIMDLKHGLAELRKTEKRHFEMVSEFYGEQKEFNAELLYRMREYDGWWRMIERQTARNTFDIQHMQDMRAAV